ncbi:uncharacterized protein K460DRAFT_409218 [Cucurbitaria berberidis CBS 394.84]|uniref:Fungal N-terminal domain-containing protein n=1 Tax=Cucurbitaria berberidis CBS 394.84 TaxID=1168544 RepID=A0A9P4GAN4_9PLEO|nr:uncharacterized protein K460DRAFT_409218 [Cucurbitaria berberidis CBS 394.84]KAF1841779.1 hypothetical protein K460DRAFT_409218 [Cucurbitaria berberidis CBS 394.84]
MPEPVGPVVSTTTIGSVAATAAQLSLDLFTVDQNFKSVPREIAEIADGISSLSGTLVTLADLMDAHQDLCTPALFQNTTVVLVRYNQVEGIKTAFTLQLNIIRVAREEITRSQTDHTSAGRALHRPNRFRTIVESDVQANRQVVESAQRVDVANSTWQRRNLHKEVDMWTKGSFDTATWLYHLVFSPRIPIPPVLPVVARQLQNQAYVSDESTEHAEDFSQGPLEQSVVPNSGSSVAVDKAMIIWGGQTEPSAIKSVKVPYDITTGGRRSSKSSMKLKRRKTQKSPKYERREGHDTSGSSEDEDFKSADEHTQRPIKSSKSNAARVLSATSDNEWNARRTESNYQRNDRYSKGDKTYERLRRKVKFEEDETPIQDAWTQSPYSGPGVEMYAPSQSHSAASQPSRVFTIGGASNQHYTSYDGTLGNDFHRRSAPIQVPGTNVSDPSFSSCNPFASSTFHTDSSAPLPAPGRPATREWSVSTPSQQPMCCPPDLTALITPSKEDAIIAAIEKLLDVRGKEQKSEVEDPRLSKIMQLLVAQQEYYDESEKATAKAAADLELKQAQAAREIVDEKIQRLESLIMRQGEEQLKAKAVLRAEQSARNEMAASLAHAKERAKEEAEARAKDELKTIEEDYARRVERYEQLIEAASSKIKEQHHQPIGPFPVRRTCVAEGNRSVEVVEYTTDNLEPLANTPLSPFGSTQEHILGPNFDRKHSADRFRHDTFHGSAATMRSSSSMSTSSTTPNTQHMILFSLNSDQNSARTLKLQALLAESGVEAVFDGTEETRRGKLTRYDRRNDDLVRSTIFWEPPVLGLASELLFTMRKAGWKPWYFRCSDAGQTFFLGSQPIHSYIFWPDFKPQFTALSTSSSNQSVIISSALVDKPAMEQLGFQFRVDDAGAYVLDGRLTVNDIEDLVERSFSIRETYLRRLHRQLQWDGSPDVNTSTDKSFAPSMRSNTPVYVTQRCTPCSNTDTKHRPPSIEVPQTNRLDVERFLIPDSEEGDLPYSRRGSTSTESPSVACWSSKLTNNPFRQHMSKMKENADVT